MRVIPRLPTFTKLPPVGETVDFAVLLTSKLVLLCTVYVFAVELCIPVLMRAAEKYGFVKEGNLRIPLGFLTKGFTVRGRGNEKNGSKTNVSGEKHESSVPMYKTKVDAALMKMAALLQKADGKTKVEKESFQPPQSDPRLRQWFLQSDLFGLIPKTVSAAKFWERVDGEITIGELEAKITGFRKRANGVVSVTDQNQLNALSESHLKGDISFGPFIEQLINFLIERELWELLGVVQLLAGSDQELAFIHRTTENYRHSTSGLLQCESMPFFPNVRALLFVLGSPRHTESTKYPALMLLCDLIAEDPSKQDGCYSGCFRENVEEFLSRGGVDLILLLAEKFVSFRRPALVIFAAVRKRIGK